MTPVLLRDLVPPARCAAIYAALQGCGKHDIGRRKALRHSYVDPPLQRVQRDVQPAVEAALGRTLAAGAVFAQTFWRGSELPKRTLMPWTGYTLNLLVHREANRPWPISFDADGTVRHFAREPGDGVLHHFSTPHWLEHAPGRFQATEILLHYAVP